MLCDTSSYPSESKAESRMLIEEALAYIDGANGKNIELGLERIKAFMKRIGRPDEKLKIIHVTGTNGKGSTCEIISKLLMAAGYKVGAFNSPYFDSPCECIRINGENIPTEQLLKEMNEIEGVFTSMKKEAKCPSGFEILVGIALKYFAREKVDFVLLEVGLGGLLDATNVISHPIACVFTKISLDHTNLLGSTIEAIAKEKAGIIKKDALVITGPQEQKVIKILEETSKASGNLFIKLNAATIKKITVSCEGTSFSYKDSAYHLSMIGKHQAYNAALALQVIESLKEAGYLKMTDEKIREGLEQVMWPGRFEQIRGEVTIYLDGAHNLDGIKALNDTIKTLEPAYTIGVVGVLRDKAYEEMLEVISQSIDELIVTKPEHIRALDEKALARSAASYFDQLTVVSEAEEALEEATKKAKCREDKVRIVCFGSLYMIASLRKKLLKH